MATAYANLNLLTVDEFLELDLKDRKAELDNGAIRMMAGALVGHNRIQGNIIGALYVALRGSGRRPFGSD